MGYYAAIAGGIMEAAGTALSAGGADKRRSKLKRIAETPGLDILGTTQAALNGYGSVFAQAAGLSRRSAEANQAALTAQEEAELPGLAAARQEALSSVRGLFADDADWLRGVQRRGAALGLSSGLFGSQAGQLQTLRLSDQEKVARTQLGTGLLGSLIGGMRIANSPGVQAFLGPTPSEQVNLRAGERTQRMGLLAQANALPTGTEMWGNTLQDIGSSLMGAGVVSGAGGGGWGGGGGVSYSGPGSAPGGWGGLSGGEQNYYNNQARTAMNYGAYTNFE